MYRFMTTRPQAQFQEKLQSFMEKNNLDVLILTSPESIAYSTGYISSMYGRGEQIGTDVSIVLRSGRVKLIVSQFTQGGAELQTKGDVDVVSYPTYMFIEDYFDPNEKEKPAESSPFKTFDIAKDIIYSNTKNVKKVGVEKSTLSYDKYVYLEKIFNESELFNAEQMLKECRMIKFPWEIEIIKYGAQITEKMMNHAMQTIELGMTEADINRIWWQSAYEFTGGHEIYTVRQAHSVGPDFWCTMMAREKPLKNGDLIRLDGGLTMYGYMTDLGRVYAVGDKVTKRQQEIFDALVGGYDVGMSLMHPGVKLSTVFKEVMDYCHTHGIPDFVRGHVGHTVGMGPGEDWPIISPSTDIVLQPGMTFCFEVPYYSTANCSYNLEDSLVITENGHEMFSNINRSLFVK